MRRQTKALNPTAAPHSLSFPMSQNSFEKYYCLKAKIKLAHFETFCTFLVLFLPLSCLSVLHLLEEKPGKSVKRQK